MEMKITGGPYKSQEYNPKPKEYVVIILIKKFNDCPGKNTLFHNSEHQVGVSLILKSITFCDNLFVAMPKFLTLFSINTRSKSLMQKKSE
jgi:hypothetical protein